MRRAKAVSLSVAVVFGGAKFAVVDALAQGGTVEPTMQMAIYFEDAAGNRDTVEYGYHPEGYDYLGTPDQLLPFGAMPDNTPFDSVFEVRAVDLPYYADWREPQVDYWKRFIGSAIVLHPTLGCYRGIGAPTFAIRAIHQPITVSWDPAVFGGNTCTLSSFLATHHHNRYWHGRDWWTDYPEFLAEAQCLSTDSTWTTYLAFEEYAGNANAIRLMADIEGGKRDWLQTISMTVTGSTNSPGVLFPPCEGTPITSVTPPARDRDLRIYPNPASNILTIDTEGSGAYSLYDALGTVQFAGTTRTIDVSALPAGVYFLHAAGQHTRVLIEH